MCVYASVSPGISELPKKSLCCVLFSQSQKRLRGQFDIYFIPVTSRRESCQLNACMCRRYAFRRRAARSYLVRSRSRRGSLCKACPIKRRCIPFDIVYGLGRGRGGGQCANERPPWSPDVGALSQTNGDDNDRDRSVCEPA